jgi:hypothetical protein
MDNREDLLARAAHKTKREIEELIAEVAPRPDAPALMRRLPRRATGLRLDGAVPSNPARRPDGLPSPSAELRLDGVLPPELGLRPNGVVSLEPGRGPAGSGPMAGAPGLRLDAVDEAEGPLRPSHGMALASAATVQPLAPGRYKVQFTASTELRDKLERLRHLMRSSVPDGDLAAIVEAAVTEKLERLEARRFARTKAPRKGLAESETSPTSRHVPAAIRRAVYERDGGRCRFVDEQGRRCTARDGLEYHHRHPFALGGDHSPAGVSLLCRTHNQYLAAIDYGRRAMSAHRGSSAGPSSLQRPT